MLDPSKFKLGNIKRSCWILQSLRHCILNDFKTNRWLFIIQRKTVSHGKYLTPHEINLCIHCEYWAFISLGWVILVSKLLFFSLPTVARKINHLDQNHPTAGNKVSQYSQWINSYDFVINKLVYFSRISDFIYCWVYFLPRFFSVRAFYMYLCHVEIMLDCLTACEDLEF